MLWALHGDAEKVGKKFVTQTEYARLRGVKKPHINRLVKKGVIVLNARNLVDVAASNRRIRESASPAHFHMGEVNDRQRKKKPGKKQVNGHRPASPYIQHRTAREQALALREQLELDRELDKVVLVDDVVKQVADQFASVRTKIRSIPSEAAPAIHRCKTVAEVEAKLRELIDESLEELTADEDGPPTRTRH